MEPAALLRLYRQMVVLRRFELTAQEHYRKGEMPGFIHLYVGEEAVAAGVCAHLRPTDWITSTHRGHGHALAKGMPPRILMAELYARATGCCGGRGGSMHLYDPAIGLFGTNGIVVGGNPAAVGAALSAKSRGTDGVAVAFFGDGGVSHGAFHESLNFAGVQRAPVVFVCENNLYATATPLRAATLNTDIASKAAAYGVPGVAVDGNDVLAVWRTAGEAVERARAGDGPTLIEARTYRQVGHHEGDPVVGVYRTQGEIDAWTRRDPILAFRKALLASPAGATAAELDAIEAEVEEEMRDAVAFARSSPAPDPSTALQHTWADPINPAIPAEAPGKFITQGWLDAVRDGVAEEMRRDANVLYFGEGTGERGGSFGQTKGLWREFGGARMIDTPICELGFTGAALGASATGCRSVADLMFADFLFEAAGQIVLQASKLRYISNGQMSAPMVVRAAAGTVKSTGPHHSGTYHSMWAHVPGLIVVMPSTPADAKGLMKTALRASDPVIFLEPKTLFSSKGPVPAGEHLVPFGEARIAREGSGLTMISCGGMIPACLEAAERLAAEDISVELIDLRSIVPLDMETIAASAAKTRRLLVVDEGYAMGGLGAEIAQLISERPAVVLDGPAGRLHTDPVSHPFSPALEQAVLITVEKIAAAARLVVAGRTPAVHRAVGAKSPAKAMPPPDTGAGQASWGHAPSSPCYAATSAPPPGTGSAALPEIAEGESLNMPHGDLTVTEATVVGWLKKPGDRLRRGETVVEVETAKSISPIESPIDGVLVRILAPEGTVVKMGQRLAIIQPEGKH